MKTINIHATCIRLARAGRAFGAPASAGILLLGPSGSGKSDLALRLIERGAVLVADDRTDLFVERGWLMARAPANIAGYIEVRGLGILELPYTDKVRVALAVDLKRDIARLPVHKHYRPPTALKLKQPAYPPRIAVNPFEASAPAKIAAAAAAFGGGLFRDNVKPPRRG
jgi:serine kinase of HPr protein (carbohydrate metabolism regulator)